MIPEPRLSYTDPGGKPRASGDDPGQHGDLDPGPE